MPEDFAHQGESAATQRVKTEHKRQPLLELWGAQFRTDKAIQYK